MNNKMLILTIFLGAALVGYTTGNVVAQEVEIGSTSGSPFVSLKDQSASGEYAIRINDGSGDFEIFDLKNSKTVFIISNGKLGVGFATPDQLLDVRQNATEPTILIQNQGGTGGAGFRFIDDSSGADWKVKATGFGGFKIRDQANGIDVMTLSPNSGNVGIGLSNPDEKLDVNGAITIKDGMSAPSTHTGKATIFVDIDGDLKIKFGDGTVKTIVIDE